MPQGHAVIYIALGHRQRAGGEVGGKVPPHQCGKALLQCGGVGGVASLQQQGFEGVAQLAGQKRRLCHR